MKQKLQQTSRKKAAAKQSRGKTRGDRNVKWIEKYCFYPEGPKVGQRVKLAKFQKQIVKAIYDTPTRLMIISFPRKNAKTALSAWIVLLHLCGPEVVKNGQLYSLAMSGDQSALLYDYAAKTLQFSDDLQEFVKPSEYLKQLHCWEIGSKFKALTAEVKTKLGSAPCFTVHDETGQHKGPKFPLYEALDTAAGTQVDPLTLIISTQAAADNDFLSIQIDDIKGDQVLPSGEFLYVSKTDPTRKLALFTFDDASGIDPFSEEAIRIANPAYDVFMNKAEVLRQAADAKRMPSNEAGYRNLILNQRVEAKNPFVNIGVWKQNGRLAIELGKRKVFAGLDLSSVRDLTSLVAIAADGKDVDVHPFFWLPEKGLTEKSRQDKTPYDIWANQGHLLTTPGASIEYQFVAEFLRGFFDRYDVECLAFDRYNMKHLKPWLIASGFSDKELEKFKEFGQGFASMGPAIRQFESMLLQGNLRHGNHPVLTMCAANAQTVSDPSENKKLIKLQKLGRIDGMVALAMAIGAMGELVVYEDLFENGPLTVG